MASKKIRIQGMKTEIWEQSFRVEGMSNTVFVGPHMTEKAVEQIVSAVWDAVYDKARAKAVQDLAEDAKKDVLKRLDS